MLLQDVSSARKKTVADAKWRCGRSFKFDVKVDPLGKSMRDRPVCLRVNFDFGTTAIGAGEPLVCSDVDGRIALAWIGEDSSHKLLNIL